MKKHILLVGILLALPLWAASQKPESGKPALEELGRLNLSEAGGAEIAAYLSSAKKLLIAAGSEELSNPAMPQLAGKKKFAGPVASVAVHGNLVAVPVMGNPSTAAGKIELFRWSDSLALIRSYPICAGADMVTFTPDGKMILAACEGMAEAGIDPPGEIALVDIAAGADQASVSILGFQGIDSAKAVSSGVRLSGPGSFIQQLEPEYITVDPSGKWAWVSLQENNALARLDLKKKKVDTLLPLGALDRSLPGNGLDYQNDGLIQIKNAPLLGLRQPDGIAALQKKNRYFVFTANEGAAREIDGWKDETKIEKIMAGKKLDPQIFSDSVIQSLKKVTLSRVEGCDTNSLGLCRAFYTFGTRSMSVFDGMSGKLLFDSSDQIERMLAERLPEKFNRNGKKEKGKTDSRSKDKGAEPENVTLGNTRGEDYAFLGLERMGGIVVFNVSNPEKPLLIDYFLNEQDRGPEGILFISEKESPQAGTALLIVCYEYSKTLAVYRVMPLKL